jgi:hypothetical protein
MTNTNRIDKMGLIRNQIKMLEAEYDELRKAFLAEFKPEEFVGGEYPKLYRGDAYQVKVYRARESKVDLSLLSRLVDKNDFFKCIKPDVTKIRAILDLEIQNQVLSFVDAKSPTVTVEPIG